jgi:Bacteriocin-protection, YdeI or OmpD-Associated/Domain of unknown function (DUF1905)/Domain of unknown function (DUF5655)
VDARAESSAPQRFRATIGRQGPNPYVDVPARVSRELAAWAQSGRIPVVGQIRRTTFQATLIPVGSGRHRLFLAGGPRAAAGIGVGDTVVVDVRATSPAYVYVPDDLDTALAVEPGLADHFAALPPSHRRELVRYLEDARSPATRQRRIDRTVHDLVGNDIPAPARRTPSPGSGASPGRTWTCPRCGQPFVTRNAQHSCHRYELADSLGGKPAAVVALFERLRDLVEACGPVTVVPNRDNVAFMVDVRFLRAVPRTRWLDLAFWLRRRVESPRWWKVETLTPDAHIHVLRVTDADQLDAEVAGWVRDAYAVGCRR